VPIPDPRVPRGDTALTGEVANPAAPPPGCYFHPRCPYAVDRCRIDPPALRRVGDHDVRCHRAEELNLAGAA
jgi:peptide/nickel transport system ATP-binding protein